MWLESAVTSAWDVQASIAGRLLKVDDKHTQANAIDPVDHIIEKLPLRIMEIRTGNGHEF